MERTLRILVADDNQDTCRYIVQHLKMETDLRVAVELAYDRDEALEKLRKAAEPFDLVITDLWMPDAQNKGDHEAGLKVLKQARDQATPADVVMITAYSSADSAFQAGLTGVREYLPKPVDYERLIHIVRQVWDERIIPAPIPESSAANDPSAMPIVGASPPMIRVMQELGRIAPTEVDVLIVGESGVGKEMIARTIHGYSRRQQGPFVPVNCAAIPESLVETALFGHEKGSFTGATKQGIGKFEAANGGTIFLDEIGDMGLPVQAKLLRVLQEKEIQRVGGTKDLKVDVRVIAATNQHLEEAVRKDEFREDLYFRLNTAVIRMPPLRERREDIPLLAEHFLHRYAAQCFKEHLQFHEDVLPYLTTRPWPGNIRELEKAIQRAVVVCTGSLVRLEHFPSAEDPPLANDPLKGFFREVAHLSLREATEEFERQFINRVLDQTQGNVTQAAKRLDMGRTALHRKMRQLGISRLSGPDEQP